MMEVLSPPQGEGGSTASPSSSHVMGLTQPRWPVLAAVDTAPGWDSHASIVCGLSGPLLSRVQAAGSQLQAGSPS